MKIAGYETHPSADLFPLMTKVELQKLADDIREHDLEEPIVLHEGMVLDGRNRLLACKLAEVEPRFIDWTGDGSPTVWVLSKNLHRRHLTDTERKRIAARAAKEFESEARERQTAGVPADLQEGGEAVAKAAEALGVSARGVYQAKRVADLAPVLDRAVADGVASLDAAATLADEPEETQRALVAAGPKAIKDAAKKKRKRKRMPRLTDDERANLQSSLAAPAENAGEPATPEEFIDANNRLAQLVERIDHALSAASGTAALALIRAARDRAVAPDTETSEAEQRYQDKRRALVDLSAGKRSNRR